MRFDLSDDQQLVRDTTRNFLEAESPLTTIRELNDLPDGFTREWWAQAASLGWLALGVPESAGGLSVSGSPGQDLAIVAEEMGRMVAPGPFLPSIVCLSALAAGEATALDPIVQGEMIVTWAFGEPGDSWDPDSFGTTARVEDDTVLLNGTKAYAEAGAQADLLLVTARSTDGLIQVLVPTDAPGIEVVPGRSLDFVRRFATATFVETEIPASSVVVGPRPPVEQVEQQLQLALLLQCAETNGAVERAYEFTIEYMRERTAFGRPIASYQALKHRLADMTVALQSCLATTDAAIDAFDSGSAESGRLARVAKAYVARHSTEILSDLVQMTGGIAVTWEHDLHLYERRVAVNRAVFGTPESHRAEVHRLISADQGALDHG